MEFDFERITDFILSNITWLIFVGFMLFSFLGGSDEKKEADSRQRPARRIERQAQPVSTYASDDRATEAAQRSRPTRPTQFGGAFDFGASSLFDQPAEEDRPSSFGSRTKFGFDETEWGTTFDKNDEQYGWGDKKSSDPVIEIGGKRYTV